MNEPTLGQQMCAAANNGVGCGIFGFGGSYTEIGSVSSPRTGDSVLVKLSDPFSALTDMRRIIMVFDNDPTRVFKVANQQEGTTQAYDIAETPDGNRIHLWIDADDVQAVDLKLLRTPDARKIVADDSRSVVDDIGDTLSKEREAAEKRSRNMLIGASILIVVVVLAAAYALPKIKIPKVGVS